MPHCDAVVHTDRVEYKGDTTGLPDCLFDKLPNSIEMNMPGDMMSMYELAMAINGFSQSVSRTPVARNRLRCGARSFPFLMVSDLILSASRFVEKSSMIHPGFSGKCQTQMEESQGGFGELNTRQKQLRIIGGTDRGRRLNSPRGNRIRPTAGMAREAIFNILADRVPGCEFLDLYAGTGSVGLEALSRGARSVTLVENDREALLLLQKNIELITRSSDCRMRTASVPNQCTRFTAEKRTFDLIFVDPPYEECGIGIRVLEAILAPDGILMHQRPARKTVGDPFRGTSLERYDRRTYGGTEISFWAHPQNPIADDLESEED